MYIPCSVYIQPIETRSARVHVQLRITTYRYAHAFPLQTTNCSTYSSTTQRLEAELCVTNYAQEVADKPHSPRIESGRGHDRSNGCSCCTRRHSQRDPSVAATAVHMALLILVYGLGCVCEKAQQTFGGPWQTTSKKKAGPGTSNGRLPRSPVEDKAFLCHALTLFIRLTKAFRGYTSGSRLTLFSSVTSREHGSLLVDRLRPARLT